MTIGEAIVLGVVQGLTEFLPISSSGHLILMRELFGIGVSSGLTFDALLHVATLLAVLVYFWRDIVRIGRGVVQYMHTRTEGKDMVVMALALGVGTIPAACAGFFLESHMESIFRDARLVAVTLVIGAVLMYGAERILAKRALETTVTVKKGFLIGMFQTLALIPGMSRSGMSIAGGMFMGLSREEAARFAFLLAIPILAGAGLKKVLELSTSSTSVYEWIVIAVGAAAAFMSGLLVVHWLMRFVRTKTLMPFVWYRIALAMVVLIVVL